MNDFTEFNHGRLLVQEAIDEAQSANKQSITCFMLCNVIDLLNREIEEINYYIVCFCETPDLLSQWRGYGGRGVAYSLNLSPSLYPLHLPSLFRTPRNTRAPFLTWITKS